MMMDSFTTTMMGAFGIFFAFITLVLIFLWFLLPFSVFGIKGLIRDAIEEQRRTNEMLKELVKKIEHLKKEETSS